MGSPDSWKTSLRYRNGSGTVVDAMKRDSSDYIAQIVGLGSDSPDGHIRLTQGQQFRVLMGSNATHEALSAWCARIEHALKAEGRALSDLSEEEFMDLLDRLNDTADP